MDTTAPSLSEHPWMEHEETGHRAQLPDIGYWRGAGWHLVDGPPPEPDLTRDAPQPETPAEEEPGSSAAKAKKTASKSAVKSAKTEEGESDR